MTTAAFVWSGAFIAGKFAIPYIPTFTLTFLRFFIASAVLFPIMKIYNRKFSEEAFHLAPSHIPFFLFTGIIGMFGYHVLFFTALKYTTAINSSMIGAMNPIVTTLITVLFLHSKAPRMQIAGIVLSFLGVLLTICGGDLTILTELRFNKGDLIMLCAVVCWAAYAVFSKAKGVQIPALALTFYSFLCCTLFLIPFVIWEKPWSLSVPPDSAVWAVIFMAVFSSVAGYLFQQIAIKKIGAARASIFVNLVPVFSIMLSVLILHEELLPVKLFTALLIIAGVYICQRSVK